MGDLVKLLDDLIKPGNWPFLVVFAVVLGAMAAFIVFWIIALVRKEQLDISHRFGPVWIHLSGGPDDPKDQPRRFRKLLYVKVNRLANQAVQKVPFYERTVARLDGPQRTVPVFDEAVYYTLKLFPKARTLGPEQDVSNGVVDPRLVIPWLSQLGGGYAGSRVPQLVDIKAEVDSDTMLSVSHFLNGLQASEHDICTYADEDAESLRLIVDFSSIPRAGELISTKGAKVLLDRQPVDTDDLKYEDCGGSVYMAHCRNAKKGYLLKMDFTFKNWSGAAWGDAPSGA